MNEKRIKIFSSLAHAKYRKEYRMFLVEGAHLVEELINSRWPIEAILAAESFELTPDIEREPGVEIARVGRKTIERIASTKTPQDIVAIARIPDRDLKKTASYGKVLIADSIKDPGNLGTIIRTAETLGFESVITTSGSVDIFNPKTVRSTQGAIFHIDLFPRASVRDIKTVLVPDHTVYALAVDGETDISSIEIGEKSALVIGSEISGVCRELLELSKYRVKIPLHGKTDSLNAAIAAGIAMYVFSKRGN